MDKKRCFVIIFFKKNKKIEPIEKTIEKIRKDVIDFFDLVLNNSDLAQMFTDEDFIHDIARDNEASYEIVKEIYLEELLKRNLTSICDKKT